MPFVKSITLGLNLDDMCKQLLWDVCQEKNIECYQLIVNSSNYTLSRKLLTKEDFIFEKDREEQYIKLIAEHTMPLGEKISTNCRSLTKALEEGNFESISMINILTLTLDYLSDVYFLKCAFNRFCLYTEIPESDVSGDTQIGIAINQIDGFITQSKNGIKTIEDSLLNLSILNKITWDEFNLARRIIPNIKEMFDKHKELHWYGNTNEKFDK